ncbi:Eukaryotic translation initiation factor 3 subunit B [Glycine soja]|uniref:Eukaryotic translation initiation factor 3 subunit B n=1 Tax=Glycine soja TaxID=3848 RepID=A0A0B2RVI4_GLYSO|nr:Eukaryotic translation initiation factor 3 subunit B [Glycine soja]
MVDVMVMKEIKDTALHLGVDLSTLDLDAIRLPPGEKCGIVRSLRSSKKWSLDGLWMPVDPETEKTLGEAELAKEKTHGYKLDRAHIFSVQHV